MKKLSFFVIPLLSLLTPIGVLAGGIVTNANQSAMYTRMQARDATLGIDAVYYNPAGLTLLPNDGLYISLNNQTVGQTRTITSSYPLLNEPEYKGVVSAPLFPGIYVAYKMNKLTFSAGFNPIGGGGGGVYDKGLPSFEYLIADIPSMVSKLGIPTTKYSADIYFEGTSVYFGYQANVSYAINKMISVALGGRYVMAKNTNKGHINDIMINPAHPLINPTGAMISATDFFTKVNQPTYAAKTANREVDMIEKGNGFTPIISLNISPSDKLNIALKFEPNTKIELKTEVIDNKSGGIYTDGELKRADIPAQLATGFTYQPIPKLFVSAGFHYYFDKQAKIETTESAIKYNRTDSLKGNLTEYALGLEYKLSKKFLVSAGWLITQTGADGAYQRDNSFSMNSNTIGGGFAYQVLPYLEVNLGGSYTMYAQDERTFNHNIKVTETYDKDVWIVALGLNFNLSAMKK
jgi:long-chain fatty acid transport protein